MIHNEIIVISSIFSGCSINQRKGKLNPLIDSFATKILIHVAFVPVSLISLQNRNRNRVTLMKLCVHVLYAYTYILQLQVEWEIKVHYTRHTLAALD